MKNHNSQVDSITDETHGRYAAVAYEAEPMYDGAYFEKADQIIHKVRSRQITNREAIDMFERCNIISFGLKPEGEHENQATREFKSEIFKNLYNVIVESLERRRSRYLRKKSLIKQYHYKLASRNNISRLLAAVPEVKTASFHRK